MERLILCIKAVLITGIAISAFWLMYRWINIPVMHISVRTGQCVEIIKDGECLPCTDIPNKYDKIWVKDKINDR